MDSRMIKPLSLKDYLLDDFSSCSSNGFKSFPRTQCCTTTVRFLIQIDLKNKKKYPKLIKSPSKSAFRRIINALKRLPFGPPTLKKSIPEEHQPIQRWKSFDQLLKEDRDREAAAAAACSSGGGNSSADVEPQVETDDVEVIKNDDVSTVDSCRTANSSTKEEKTWRSDAFSPTSVLDCPFKDDEEVSSGIEPLNLAKRFEEFVEVDQKAMDLLQQLKDTLPWYADKLLVDFFKERIENDQNTCLEEADNWISGTMSAIEWGIGKNKEAYMEEWRRSLDGQVNDVITDLETTLFDELLVDTAMLL